MNLTKCEDIDECVDHLLNGCTQLCLNTEGKCFLNTSFYCLNASGSNLVQEANSFFVV